MMDWTNSVLTDPIRRPGFLAGISQEEIVHILSGEDQDRNYRDGEIIFAQGAPANATYFVLEGRVEWQREMRPVGNNRPILHYHVTENHLLGQYALLYNAPYPMTAMADGSCRLLRMDNQALDRLIYRFPTIRNAMMPTEIIGRLRTIPWLTELDEFEISLMADVIEQRRVEAGNNIYDRVDTDPDFFYIIDRGQVRLIDPKSAPQKIGYLGNGTVFGLAPMLEGHSHFRNVAEARVDSDIFVVPRRLLEDAARFLPAMSKGDNRQEREQVLKQIPLFKDLSTEEIALLAGYFSYIRFPNAHLIALQEESSSALWVLMPGSRATLHVLKPNGEALAEQQIGGPIHFGEASLLLESPISSTIKAHANSEWLKLDRRDFLAFDREQDGRIRPKLKPGPDTRNLQRQLGGGKRFAWLGTDEILLLNDRRHWLILVQKMIPSLILGGILGLLLLAGWGFAMNNASLNIAVVVAGVLTALAGVWGWVDYWNDFLLLTNKRVVQQDKVIVFKETRREAPLYQIQDIEVQTNLIGSLLGYGKLVIQTASKEGSIIFDFAHRPQRMREQISQQIQQQGRYFKAQNKMQIQSLLEARLGIRLILPDRVLLPGQEFQDSTSAGFWSRLWERIRTPAPPETHGNRIVWRQHWLILWGKMLTPAAGLLFAVVLGVAGLLGQDINLPLFEAIEWTAIFIGLIALAVMAWIHADWRNDTYEVTDTTIVDISKKPLFFAENRRQAQLSEIQDIQFDMPTPIHFIFNFGDVKISTAASTGVFTFDRVPNPAGVVDEIRRRIERWRKQDEENRAKRRAEELPDWFEIYKRLDDRGR